MLECEVNGFQKVSFYPMFRGLLEETIGDTTSWIRYLPGHHLKTAGCAPKYDLMVPVEGHSANEIGALAVEIV